MKTDAGIRAVTIVFALGEIKIVFAHGEIKIVFAHGEINVQERPQMQLSSIFFLEKSIFNNIELGRRLQKTSFDITVFSLPQGESVPEMTVDLRNVTSVFTLDEEGAFVWTSTDKYEVVFLFELVRFLVM